MTQTKDAPPGTRPYGPGGVWLDDQKKAKFASFKGDSGGPVWKQGRGQAWGIMVAGGKGASGKPATFTPIATIMDRFDVTVVGAG